MNSHCTSLHLISVGRVEVYIEVASKSKNKNTCGIEHTTNDNHVNALCYEPYNACAVKDFFQLLLVYICTRLTYELLLDCTCKLNVGGGAVM